MNIINNDLKIIRRNDLNELNMNGHVVPSSNFDQLYPAVLSLRGSQHITGMTKLLRPWRQLNVQSKDIVSNLFKAAYDSGAARSGLLRNNNNALPSQPPKATKKNTKAPPIKRKSPAPFEIERPNETKAATRSKTKYNTQRPGRSYVTNKNQSGNGIKFSHILYVY